MSFRVVRSSKYRHVFGTAAKKEVGYDGIRISRNAWDSPFCSVNPLFLAVVLEAEGGGAFQVIPLEQVGRIDMAAPKVVGHKAPVLDIQFCPYNDYLIASASEDCTVKVWNIPKGGFTENCADASVTLEGHQRRVGIVEWHPTAENILASAGFDYLICLWDIGTGKLVKEIQVHADTIYSISFNYDGRYLATTCKDKMLRMIDARSGEVVQQGVCHDGAKAARVIFTGENNRLFTTGFSKTSERQLAIWDPSDFSAPLKVENIDTGSGVIFSYYDDDTKMVYLVGKGDGNIRYYELDDERPYCHFLSEFKTSLPQRGVGLMPKRGCNIAECEVAKFFKLHPKGFVEVIGFTVPRKSTLFQDDIFPPTKDCKATLTAAEWLSGKNKAPGKVSLKDGFVPSTAAAAAAFKAPEQEVAAKDETPQGEKELLKAWHAQKAEIEALKKRLATAEIKLRKYGETL